MAYINKIDINGEIYNLGNLTDGTHVVNLPTLTQSGTFLLQSDVVDNLTTNSGEKVLSAAQGKELEDKKFDKIGGIINGPVTLNGDLAMGSDNIISVTKAPVTDNDVVNKQYVDNAVSSTEFPKVPNDGHWRYMKMSNGYAIAWYSAFDEVPLSSGDNTDPINHAAYPVNLFVENPYCLVDITTYDAACVIYNIRGGTSTTTPSVDIDYFGSSNQGARLLVNYLAIGKWKL